MNAAIIVAAGKGTRMGANVDKLWLEVAGRPVLAHTWKQFNDATCIHEIILVVRDGMQEHFAELAVKYSFKKPFRLIVGGAERQDSVWNGLAALGADCEVVAIQDAARPCTSEALIAATIAAARDLGAAVAAQPVTDTLKETQDGQTISRTVDRSRLWSVQTPQSFFPGHSPGDSGGAGPGLETHGRHGGLRVDRPACPAGGQCHAESQSHRAGRFAFHCDFVAKWDIMRL